MQRDLKIEAAKPTDADGIGDLYVASRAVTLSFLREVHTPSEMRAWVRDILLVRQTTWVARVDDELFGFMTLDEDNIDQLYLHPEMRRRGIGSALVAHAKTQNPHGLRLVTFQKNLTARAFYEKHGFIPVAFGDGSNNEEGEPDVFYEWKP